MAGFQPIKTSIHIEGAKELDTALRELPRAVMRKIERKGLREAAKMVLDRAKQICPIKTGALLASLKIKAGKRRKNYINIIIGTASGWFKGKTYYGGFVEFGTSKMAAKPFVRPAFDSQREGLVNKFITSISDALYKVWSSKTGHFTES